MNKKNNKGFSLIELIVVVAIMAVLVGVLAPTYLRYVEKTRLQKDVSAVSEVVQAVKVACAEETVNAEVAKNTAGLSIELPKTLDSNNGNALEKEVALAIKEVKFESSSFGADDKVTVTAKVDTTTKSVTVTVRATIKDTDVKAMFTELGDTTATSGDGE